MSYLVIPNEVFANDAIVWVAAVNENLNPAATVLEYGSRQTVLSGGWSNFTTADRKFTIHYQRVNLNNLTQQTNYPLTLRVNNEWKADGSFRTIPWKPSRPPETRGRCGNSWRGVERPRPHTVVFRSPAARRSPRAKSRTRASSSRRFSRGVGE